MASTTKQSTTYTASAGDYYRLRKAIVAWGKDGSGRDWKLMLDIVDTIAATAMRASEALALTADDVWDEGDRIVITVREGKRGIRRVVAPDAIVPMLEIRRHQQGEGDGPLFAARNGGPISQARFLGWFRACRDIAGLPNGMVPHSLRKMAATQVAIPAGPGTVRSDMAYATSVAEILDRVLAEVQSGLGRRIDSGSGDGRWLDPGEGPRSTTEGPYVSEESEDEG